MDRVCFYQGCNNPAIFKCYCNQSGSPMCRDHTSDHCLVSGSHKLDSIVTQLTTDAKLKFIEKNSQKIKFISVIKERLEAETSELLRLITQRNSEAVDS